MFSTKINKYQSLPFCKETPRADFYGFLDLSELRAARRAGGAGVRRCRALGALHSDGGRFYLSSINDPANMEKDFSIKVCMDYVKSPLPSTVVPFPVQIFGYLQWQPEPVLFASIIQNLPVRMALQLNSLLKDLTKKYVATNSEIDVEGS